MKGRKGLIILVSMCLILLVISPVVASCTKPASQSTTLEIGVLEALTGFGSASELPMWEGIQVHGEWINDQGGITINRQQYLIKYVVEDTKGSADGAVAAANKLVYDHKVKFILGDVMPFTLDAIGTVTEPAKVLHANQYNVCMPSEFGPEMPYTFLVDLGTLGYITGVLTYVADAYPTLKTMVMVHPDDGSIPFTEPKLTKIANDLGLSMVGDTIAWPMDTVDFTPVIAKAIAREPDMLLLPNGWPAAIGSMLKAAREAGFTGLVLTDNPCDDIATVAGPAASTNLISSGTVIDDPMNTSVAKELTERMKTKIEHVTWYNLWGLGSAYIFVNAIEEAQSLDPTEVKDKWGTMKTIDTPYGKATMGGQETYGINHAVVFPCGIVTLMDNQIKMVEWQTIEIP